MRRQITLALTAIGLATASALPLSAQLEAPAASATEIRPLLVGSEVPSAEVRTLDGESADLRALISGQPSLIIFYRGGW